MTLAAPFDFETHFMTTLAGSPEIFSFLVIILLSIGLGKYNFSNKVALAFYALFGVIMASYLQGLYVIIILLSGLVTYYSLSKMAR